MTSSTTERHVFRYLLTLCILSSLSSAQPTTDRSDQCSSGDDNSRQAALTEQMISTLQEINDRQITLMKKVDSIYEWVDNEKEKGRICHSVDRKRVCYKLNYYQVSWSDGRRQCIADGGDLVSIESEREWNFILSAILENPKECHRFHTSGRKRVSGKWVWTATGMPFTYTAWGPLEPNGNGDLCVLWEKMVGWTKWDDEKSNISSCFICEFP